MMPVLPSTLLLLTLWSGTEAEAPSSKPEPPSKSRQGLNYEDDTWLKPVSEDVWKTSELAYDLSLPDTIYAELKVRYGDMTVARDTMVMPTATSEAPEVSLKGAINCMPPFALVMVDPDVPSREQPTERSRVHWMVLNANSTERLHEGEEAVPYSGPSPPEGTGPHRYVFLAYCQGGKWVSSDDIAPKRRNKFELGDFAANLDAGNAFGGTFFYAENA
ncbi:hypothetical protein V5799_000420 [Amblyomma americanum]|uniref:Phosphatidylethanolamine-binding protein n=1 Tax=Amblyomma americanum TaxID=6943 RepID=A0AAQ4D339_AMBAM